MNILRIILATLIIILAIIIFIIIIPLHITIVLEDDKFKIKLFNIPIFKMKYAKIIAIILEKPKSKININIKALMECILIEKIEVFNPIKLSPDIEAMIYGGLNVLAMLYESKVHNFIFKNQNNDRGLLVNIKIKFQLLNILLKQYQAMRKLKYGK